jgi:hypothetical protein
MDRAYQQKDADELRKLAGCATRDWEVHTGKVRPSLHESHEAAVSETPERPTQARPLPKWRGGWVCPKNGLDASA